MIRTRRVGLKRYAKIEEFITIWDTTLPQNGVGSNQITFFTVGDHDFSIDVGNGYQQVRSMSGVESINQHTFSTTGSSNLVVKIKGYLPKFNTSYFGAINTRFKGINKFGFLKFNGDIRFTNCPNLITVNAEDTPSDITALDYMFSYCTNLTNIVNIENWDLSKATSLQGMFSYCTNFNQNLNGLNVSNVSNMSAMFSHCTNYNQPLNNWNVGNLVTATEMFASATSFNQPLNSWNTSNIVQMGYMFNAANVFNQPLNNWNTSKVINMDTMFKFAHEFNQNLSSWDTSNVEVFGQMFRATKFNYNINNWNTSKVTNMNYMFQESTFNQPLNNWDISKVTDMRYMFYNAISFNQDLSSWNFISCTNVSEFINGGSVGLSISNYDKLLDTLNRTATNVVDKTLTSTRKYSFNGETTRQNLITKGWTINDSGLGYLSNYTENYINHTLNNNYTPLTKRSSLDKLMLNITPILNKMDVFYLFVGDGDINSKTLNVVDPTKYKASPYGGLIWDADGCLGNNTNGFLDTNFNPSLNVVGQKYQLNNASKGYLQTQDRVSSQAFYDGISSSVTYNSTQSQTTYFQRMNSSINLPSNMAINSLSGLKVFLRDNATEIYASVKDVRLDRLPQNSEPFPNDNYLIHRRGGASGVTASYGTNKLGCVFFGSAISHEEIQTLRTHINEFLINIGLSAVA